MLMIATEKVIIEAIKVFKIFVNIKFFRDATAGGTFKMT